MSHFYDLAPNLSHIYFCRSPHHCIIIFTNPSARAGYDTRSIFKRSSYNGQQTGLSNYYYRIVISIHTRCPTLSAFLVPNIRYVRPVGWGCRISWLHFCLLLMTTGQPKCSRDFQHSTLNISGLGECSESARRGPLQSIGWSYQAFAPIWLSWLYSSYSFIYPTLFYPKGARRLWVNCTEMTILETFLTECK